MRANRILMALLAVAAIGAGCAPVSDEDDPNAAAVDEASEEARAAWERFAGAWSGTGSAFSTLVFTRTSERTGRHFFGEQQVTCVRAPCDPIRVEGYYTAGTRYLTLNVGGDATRYSYTIRGETLTLSRYGRVLATLTRVPSYCRDSADAAEVCSEQGLITPRCLGYWTCSSESRCAYRCGLPTGGEGATCGGIAGLRCNDGLTCVTEATHPDATGTCRRVANEGEACGGGSVRYPAVCAEGLTCVPPAAGAPVGASGVCRRAAACRRTGCSGQICADRDLISTCEYRPEYACYRTATCERQADGNCGWTQTPELLACLSPAPAPYCAAVLCAATMTCCESLRRCVPIGTACPPPADAFCPRVRCAAGNFCCESARACLPNGSTCR